MKRIEVYKETTDDFHPNFKISAQGSIQPKEYILLFLSELTTKQFRIAAWGADDFGMNRDFKSDEYELAMHHFLELVTYSKPITKNQLKRRGFKCF